MVEIKQAFLDNENYEILTQLDKAITGLKCAIYNMENINSASKTSTTSNGRIVSEELKIKMKEEMLPTKILELSSVIQKREYFRSITPIYYDYQNSLIRLNDLYDEIGLTTAIEKSSDRQFDSSLNRQKMGKSFEEISSQVVTVYLIPYLAKLHGLNPSDLFSIRNVKFGLAGVRGSAGELDCIVCTYIPRPERFKNLKIKALFCQVLGVIEMKRNPNDIGQAFIGYQRSLAWLSGYTVNSQSFHIFL